MSALCLKLGRKRGRNSWSPTYQTQAPSATLNNRHHTMSVGMSPPMAVTEDTPPDMLTGNMSLKLVLPSGKKVKMSVDRGTPMMDLLVHLTTSQKLSPAAHILQPYGEHGILPYKPSTPIGALDTVMVHIVPKNQLAQNQSNKMAMKQVSQPFEQTYRIQVTLPRNQLYVLRANGRTTMADILNEICLEKNLDLNKYSLRHPKELDKVLQKEMTIAEYRHNQLCLVSNKSSPTSHVSTDDIINAIHNYNNNIYSFERSTRSLSPDSSVSPVAEPPKPLRRKKPPAPKPPASAIPSGPVLVENNKQKEKAVNGSCGNAAVISHSRTSSDSSGYHEASLLSESPHSNNSSLPDSLPRRSKLPDSTTLPGGPLSRSLSNLAANNTENTLKPAQSTSCLHAPGRKKRPAPPPPAAMRTVQEEKKEVEEFIEEKRIDEAAAEREAEVEREQPEPAEVVRPPEIMEELDKPCMVDQNEENQLVEAQVHREDDSLQQKITPPVTVPPVALPRSVLVENVEAVPKPPRRSPIPIPPKRYSLGKVEESSQIPVVSKRSSLIDSSLTLKTVDRLLNDSNRSEESVNNEEKLLDRKFSVTIEPSELNIQRSFEHSISVESVCERFPEVESIIYQPPANEYQTDIHKNHYEDIDGTKENFPENLTTADKKVIEPEDNDHLKCDYVQESCISENDSQDVTADSCQKNSFMNKISETKDYSGLSDSTNFELSTNNKEESSASSDSGLFNCSEPKNEMNEISITDMDLNDNGIVNNIEEVALDADEDELVSSVEEKNNDLYESLDPKINIEVSLNAENDSFLKLNSTMESFSDHLKEYDIVSSKNQNSVLTEKNMSEASNKFDSLLISSVEETNNDSYENLDPKVNIEVFLDAENDSFLKPNSTIESFTDHLKEYDIVSSKNENSVLTEKNMNEVSTRLDSVKWIISNFESKVKEQDYFQNENKIVPVVKPMKIEAKTKRVLRHVESTGDLERVQATLASSRLSSKWHNKTNLAEENDLVMGDDEIDRLFGNATKDHTSLESGVGEEVTSDSGHDSSDSEKKEEEGPEWEMRLPAPPPTFRDEDPTPPPLEASKSAVISELSTLISKRMTIPRKVSPPPPEEILTPTPILIDNFKIQSYPLRRNNSFEKDLPSVGSGGVKRSASHVSLLNRPPTAGPKVSPSVIQLRKTSSELQINIVGKSSKERPVSCIEPQTLQSVQVLKSILPQLSQSQSSLNTIEETEPPPKIIEKEEVNEVAKEERKWSTLGRPAVSLSTWGERPKRQVSIKSDRDYVFGGSLVRKHKEEEESYKNDVPSVPAPVLPPPNPSPPPTPTKEEEKKKESRVSSVYKETGNTRPLRQILGDGNRLPPVVRSVELKPPYTEEWEVQREIRGVDKLTSWFETASVDSSKQVTPPGKLTLSSSNKLVDTPLVKSPVSPSGKLSVSPLDNIKSSVKPSVVEARSTRVELKPVLPTKTTTTTVKRYTSIVGIGGGNDDKVRVTVKTSTRVIPEPTPDPRQQLLESIRDFGKTKSLKKVR